MNVPTTEALAEDVRGLRSFIDAFVTRGLLRMMTAEEYGEVWSDAEHELDLLEVGRGQVWDALDYDDDDEW